MDKTREDYTRKWVVMAAISMGTLLATIDSSIVNVALPTLVRALNTDFPTVQWVVLAYLLTLAVLLLSVGRLGDMVGKKQIYTIGFAVFTVGSLLCGLSPNVYFLILFRVVQAVGATMIMALGTAIVTESFPPKERGKALGIIGTVVSVGIVIGPTLGGLILDVLPWNWIFYVNIPVGVIGILMVLRNVPDIQPKGRQRFDFLGAITLFISLLALLSALTFGQNLGFTDYRILALFAAWALFLSFFVWTETRVQQPMIDLSLFRNTLFSINLVTGFITFISIAGMFILLPFNLENNLGYSTREVGLLIAVVSVSMGLIAPISGTLSDRLGTRLIAVIGLAILLVGYGFLTTVSADTSTFAFVLLLIPIGLGMGVFQSPNNSAIMGTAPPDKLGIVSGMLALTRTLGQSTGIATIGAVWAALALAYPGAENALSATETPATAQIMALQNTFIVIACFIAVALLLAVWALVKERKLHIKQ